MKPQLVKSTTKLSAEEALELIKKATMTRAQAKKRWDQAEADADAAHQEYRKADGDLRRARLALSKAIGK